jgi:hypothetical protein
LIPLAGKRVLAIAKTGVYRHQAGKKTTERFPPIATRGPFVAGAGERAASFWVRALGERSRHDYELGAPIAADADSPGKPLAPSEVQVLPDFDARLFSALADGTPAYSTASGLVRYQNSEPSAAAQLPAGTTLVFGDANKDRYWTADAEGNLSLWAWEAGESPIDTARVPGVVVDTAVEGTRVAVLSVALIDTGYQPTVTVFVDGKQDGRLRVATSPARSGQPTLDLCLIEGRPWVVVATPHWMHLLDWATPRLLAEW